MQTSDMKVHK